MAQARANRFKLEHAIEDVNNQVAVLRANVAALQTAEARQARAKADYDRAIDVAQTPGAISQQDIDLRKESFRVAEAQVKQALEQVYQIRVSLGLPREAGEGHDLSEVPADLDQNFFHGSIGAGRIAAKRRAAGTHAPFVQRHAERSDRSVLRARSGRTTSIAFTPSSSPKRRRSSLPKRS